MTESPVMQTAEHAVNSASYGFIQTCAAFEMGSMRRNAPNRIVPI